MSTPSAPRAKAVSTSCGSSRPEHISRITQPLGGYFMRDTPARSAAVYVHQLQKNATMRGCHSRSGIGQYSFHFTQQLIVLKKVLPNRPGGAGSHADTAAFAQGLVDLGLLLASVE